MNNAPLTGMRVLVTRPAAAAAALGARIERAGGEAILFPVIEILPPRDPTALSNALDDLATTDLAVFVSAHAAARVGVALRQRAQRMPMGVRVAAVGPGTAAQCARNGIEVDFVADAGGSIGSEGLLNALRDFGADGRSVLIFRAEDGRELLRDELIARGARVRYVECYRRARAEVDAAPLLARWRDGEVDAVAVTSVAIADALWAVLGDEGRALLARTAVFAYSERVAAHCRELGATRVRVSVRPDDDALIAALIDSVEWIGARSE